MDSRQYGLTTARLEEAEVAVDNLIVDNLLLIRPISLWDCTSSEGCRLLLDVLIMLRFVTRLA